MRRAALLLAWWFLAWSNTSYTHKPTVVGPFMNEQDCNNVKAAWLAADKFLHRALPRCWYGEAGDGR